MNFSRELQKKTQHAEEVLKKYGTMPKDTYQQTVMDAMEYCLFSGGKRLRPVMMYETFKMFGGRGLIVEPFMAAIEMIHTYSLIHDDLPAMDNDEYRRGRKTAHIVYGEDMAILAGDALLNYAFETALKAFDKAAKCNYDRVAGAASILGAKAGIFGMVGGQTFDVEAEDKNLPLTMEQLLFIFNLKTAALIEASMMIGAVLAGASPEEVEIIEQVAKNVGIAFQIQDDVLDVISTQDILGKPIGSDEKNNKTTYVTLVGVEQAQKDVRTYSEKALEELNKLPHESEFLTELIGYLTDRIK